MALQFVLNHLATKVILQGKIFIKVYLIENKEVILLIQLNW